MLIGKERQDLEDKLKKKISEEADNYILKVGKRLVTLIDFKSPEFINDCKRVSLFSNIKDYIINNPILEDISYSDKEHTIYTIKDETIEICLEEDFSWCCAWERVFGINFYPASAKEIEYGGFINIIDRIEYEQKKIRDPSNIQTPPLKEQLS